MDIGVMSAYRRRVKEWARIRSHSTVVLNPVDAAPSF